MRLNLFIWSYRVIRRLLVCLLVLTAAVSVASWADVSPPPAASLTSIALPPAIERVLRDYEKAWTARNDAALARLFTSDGYALPNGQLPAAGAAAIRAAYAQNAGMPLALRALHYAESADMAYVIGGFGGGDGKPDFGKFVLVLRRGADGIWRIAADMDNANALPKRAPAAKP